MIPLLLISDCYFCSLLASCCSLLAGADARIIEHISRIRSVYAPSSIAGSCGSFVGHGLQLTRHRTSTSCAVMQSFYLDNFGVSKLWESTYCTVHSLRRETDPKESVDALINGLLLSVCRGMICPARRRYQYRELI